MCRPLSSTNETCKEEADSTCFFTVTIYKYGLDFVHFSFKYNNVTYPSQGFALEHDGSRTRLVCNDFYAGYIDEG